ncbi:primosomal protein N' [Thiomicrospira microaerophila]|uniref:primosomal protein N' n=1 Tax=Thiomicrospira microaerophila TaxID=406020 RepID=UPI000698A330|nr:primosomal protein N' [Thiomicrospira microaerophila]
MIIQVAVSGPFLALLDYKLTRLCDIDKVQPGQRVFVPFRQQKKVGLIVGLNQHTVTDSQKIKPIYSLIDQRPIVNAIELRFLFWMADYYHEPLGEVVMAALPKRIRAGESVEAKGVEYWQITLEGKKVQLSDFPARATKQRALWQAFLTNQAWSAGELNTLFQGWRPQVKRWLEKAWLMQKQAGCLEKPILANKPSYKLNAEQQEAVNQVLLSQDVFNAFLLQGVTGSGKTEVYLAIIESVLASGKQALVLVPEIGLTPQTVARFEAYLQQPVAILHSNLSDQERHCAWHASRTHQVNVVLGTRSALFTPFANLGLCILDEEHDLSFKQQDGFRYSARDGLVRRAQLEKVPVILGSATPCLESLYNADQGRYKKLVLSQRAGSANLPLVHVLDVRGERLVEGVSAGLKVKMQQHLLAGGQVLLFLNRRGYAPVLMCHDCGWQAVCPSCDANLTYHRAHNVLKCHHCGYSQKAPLQCPRCTSDHFVPVGQGTERLAQKIQEWFVDKQVLRIDSDTTRRKGALAQKVEQARSGNADILIGTQMLAKGHHFPKVTLVGLIDIDQGLFSVDYRAAERMAQLVTQVAGRAGRAERQGEVIIQTYHPDHPLLLTLVNKGYQAFADQALVERKLAGLPPYGFQIVIRTESVAPQDGLSFLEGVKQLLMSIEVSQPCELWGPVSAPMERRQGRFRYQLLLQSSSRPSLQAWLSAIESRIYTLPYQSKVRWSIDVDPQELR